jgi:ATP adenylyltransferase
LNNEQLWAPWRLGYIKGNEPPAAPADSLAWLPGAERDCFLCRDAVENSDRHNLVVQRGPRTMTVLNRYPYNNGHLLVAPLRHVGRLPDLSADEHLECMQSVTRLVTVLEQTIQAEGFNVGLNLGRVAGAGVPGHLHWHIVPRWNGDTSFMPTLAGVKVIPQSLDALWELLTAELAREGGERG